MNRKLPFVLFVLALACCATGTMHAIGGCNDSPEAPTDILLLVGAGGMVYGSRLVSRIVRNKRHRP